MKRVRKGVIIVAGLGTRFLPATKATPKEMLPVLDKPVVQYIVEEMVASGISEILFVTSSQKRPIEDHFDRDAELEQRLEAKGKIHLIQPLIELCKKVRFHYTRQGEALGNGHALLCARDFVGDEPFVFSDGDSIIDARIPVVKQLLTVFYKEHVPVIGVQRLDRPEHMVQYGNVYGTKTRRDRVYRVNQFVEKPQVNAVSPLGLIVGGMRYVLTKDIWPILETQTKGKDGEIWFTDAANRLAEKKKFLAYEYEGQYFDTGNKLALLKTTIHFAMKDEAMKNELLSLFTNL